MPKRTILGLMVAALLVVGRGAEPTENSPTVVRLPSVVVKDSKAGVFCPQYVPADPPRWEFFSFEEPRPRGALRRSEPGGRLYLTALRSYDLRVGDELIRIDGRAVAGLTEDEVLRLLKPAESRPVEVEVRSPGKRGTHKASLVRHGDVKAGIKVPRVP